MSFLKKNTPHFGNDESVLTQINVLGLGLDENEITSQNSIFSNEGRQPCVELTHINDASNLRRTLYRCGDISLLNVHAQQRFNLNIEEVQQRDELKTMISTGKISWGAQVEKASVFGYYLGNHWWYWNDFVSSKDKPHVVFKRDTNNDFPVPDALIYHPSNQSIHNAKKTLKDRFILNHLNWAITKSYDQGYSDGKQNEKSNSRYDSEKSFDAGFQTGKTQSTPYTYNVSVNNNNSTELYKCQKNLTESRELISTLRKTNSEAYMNGYQEAERLYKKK
jgi:hypothetical protein